METGILHLHSALRYVVLLMLVISIIVAIRGNILLRVYTNRIMLLHRNTRLLLMAQGVIGIILYLLNGYPGQFAHIGHLSHPARFYLLRHLVTMLVGISICSIGFAGSLKLGNDQAKFKRIATFYSIGLVIIVSAIPFPFLQSWARWF